MKTSKFGKYSEITPLQLFFLTFLGQLGAGLLTLPRQVTAIAGQDGWISVILATLLNMLAAAIIVKLAQRFKGLSLMEISQKVFGKFLGYLISISYIVYFFCCAAYVLMVSVSLVTVWILPGIPVYLIAGLYLLALVYLLRNGLKVMVRLYTLYFYHVVPLFLILSYPILRFEPRFVFPVGTKGLLAILKGIQAPLFAFLGFESILVFNPFITEPEKAMLPVQAATALVGFLYTITVFGLTSYFGVGELQFQLWPTIYMARTIEIVFLERLDIFTDIIWIIVVFTTLAMYYYLLVLGLTRLLKIKDHKILTLCLIIPVYFFTALFNGVSRSEEFGKYVSLSGAFHAMILPVLIYIISYFRKIKGGNLN